MNPENSTPMSVTNDPAAAEARLHSRRDFLKRFGGGLVVFLALRDTTLFAADAEAESMRPGAQTRLPTDFNAFVRIGEDGRVTCFTGKIEMGQGPITSLPQMMAEELDVAVDNVDIVMGDTDLCPWDAGTWGSLTTRSFGPAFRAAGAEARGVLLLMAAESLKVPVAQLTVQNGVVVDQQDSTHWISYGQLTKGKNIERHLDVKAALKDPASFKVMGKSMLRRDARDKVTGRAQYSGDIRLPGMLYAKILRPPAHGAKLQTVDLAAARLVAGVQVVQDGDLVAVLHEAPDVAEDALAKIKATFDVPEAKVDDQTIFDHLMSMPPPAANGARAGDLETGRQLASRKFTTTYLNSYVAHAAMETHTALANIESGVATVWASTQNPFGAQNEIAKALGFQAKNVRVIAPFLGGAFGGKAMNLQAVEAARLAKATGRPVQVMWSREEEFFYDAYRPAAIVKIDSGIDAAGKITYWDFKVFFAGNRGADHFYAIPHSRTEAHGASWTAGASAHPLLTGAWRGPGVNTNTHARESQIDLMAAAAGVDPVEFRLNNLTDQRMVRVLRAAAEKFGWKPAPAPSRRGYGVACGIDAGTYVATIAEVAVDPVKHTVQVKRVVCAQDMGVVVNPQGARLQTEGCIMMGLGCSLTEEIHFKGGRVLDTNFDTYQLPRFSGTPKMEAVFIENSGLAPQGCGEPALIVMSPVIANAIHDAIGVRLLQLPMTPERIRAALATKPA